VTRLKLRAPGLVLAVLVPLLLSGCSNEPSVPTSDIVSTIPWMAPEELTYTLTDEDGTQIATGTHTIEQEGTNFRLRTRYESPNGNSDTTTVTVDALTLKPISSVREIDNDNPDDEDRIEAEYTDETVVIRAGERQ